MDLIQLEESARDQHEALGQAAEALWRHAFNSRRRLRADQLEALGITKATPLEVDEQEGPSGFPDRRFFRPSFRDEHLTHALDADDPEFVAGIVETGRKKEKQWGETFRPRPRDDDDDWMPPYPEDLPQFRSMWYRSCLRTMQQLALDEEIWWWQGDEEEELPEQREHEARTDGWRGVYSHVEPGDSTYRVPRREAHNWDFRTLWLEQPRDPGRPHLAVVMGDSEVVAPGEDDVLVSELLAAVEYSRRQLSCGDFSSHHTRPIIIFTLMSETHARITQAHVDAKAAALVVRQSRVLDLRGRKPTPDAYLLLRWMMNIPVGETEHKLRDEGRGVEEGGGDGGGSRGRGVPLLVSPRLAVVAAG
ncbi:hypothetical protein KVR01_003098 [Diaporthe batatas]|uniref:uncharacterized protein n=1 Tax=Diaporthe batatas TaxID=748121 RepID=UPI001D0367E8|nr:uncharacterized protein KVR01_003098 [Diaporthe batatas]KAG8167409.1 hypothetical protein KVR01_003098 [Diaporthe batatas]